MALVQEEGFEHGALALGQLPQVFRCQFGGQGLRPQGLVARVPFVVLAQELHHPKGANIGKVQVFVPAEEKGQPGIGRLGVALFPGQQGTGHAQVHQEIPVVCQMEGQVLAPAAYTGDLGALDGLGKNLRGRVMDHFGQVQPDAQDGFPVHVGAQAQPYLFYFW